MTPGNTNAEGSGAEIDRMLMMWNATDTWDTFGGDGIQADDIEALGTPDWNTGSVIYGEIRIDVTPSMKLWQAGTTNRGWAFLPNSTNQWQIFSSDAEAINERPRLVVIAKNVPPKVDSVVINNGAAQRSRVDSITINFSTTIFGPGATPPTASAFELKRFDGLTVVPVVTTQVVDGRTVATLSGFSGPGTDFGSLGDGRWTVRVISNLIENSDGQKLDGNSDGVGGDDYALGFHRLFGDADGNATVNSTDFSIFRTFFGVGPSMFDFNNDGQTNSDDFAEFRKRFGTTLP
jgi:hypothetical protein